MDKENKMENGMNIMDKEVSRRQFISGLGAGLITLGLTGCGIKIPGNSTEGSGTKIPESSTGGSSNKVNVSKNFELIKGGTFDMGSPESEVWRGNDETLHSVTVSDFYMSAYEVTQQEYQSLMGTNPSTFSSGSFPVENISWFDAITYCNARSKSEGLTPVYTIDGQSVGWDRSANGYRLPTEAEWEYACRAGTTTPFNTKTSVSADEVNYFGHYPYKIEENYFSQGKLDTRLGKYRQTTTAVGSFSPNKLGLYDMHGNVGEWCWDNYGKYDAKTATNPTGPSTGSFRINRGGGWNDFAKHLRSAYRSSAPAGIGAYNIGFRLVRSAVLNADRITSSSNISGSQSGKGKILIAYFSWSGNTRGIAQKIKQQTGADILEIECVTPYSSDYSTVLDQAQKDQNRQARPELKTHVDNMKQYDVIMLGCPNWWASITMPIASFLEKYDFSGKTIIPFCSHGGGRFGQIISAITKLAPDSKIQDGLSVSYSGGSSLSGDITKWLATNGVAAK